MAKARDQPSGHGITAHANEDNVRYKHGGQEKKQWREQESQSNHDSEVNAEDGFEPLGGHRPRSLFERISRPDDSTLEQPSAHPDQRTQRSNPRHSPGFLGGSRYTPDYAASAQLITRQARHQMADEGRRSPSTDSRLRDDKVQLLAGAEDNGDQTQDATADTQHYFEDPRQHDCASRRDFDGLYSQSAPSGRTGDRYAPDQGHRYENYYGSSSRDARVFHRRSGRHSNRETTPLDHHYDGSIQYLDSYRPSYDDRGGGEDHSINESRYGDGH